MIRAASSKSAIAAIQPRISITRELSKSTSRDPYTIVLLLGQVRTKTCRKTFRPALIMVNLVVPERHTDGRRPSAYPTALSEISSHVLCASEREASVMRVLIKIGLKVSP
jgi:hypothetical protein